MRREGEKGNNSRGKLNSNRDQKGGDSENNKLGKPSAERDERLSIRRGEKGRRYSK